MTAGEAFLTKGMTGQEPYLERKTLRRDVNRASMAPFAEINPTGYFRN